MLMILIFEEVGLSLILRELMLKFCRLFILSLLRVSILNLIFMMFLKVLFLNFIFIIKSGLKCWFKNFLCDEGEKFL